LPSWYQGHRLLQRQFIGQVRADDQAGEVKGGEVKAYTAQALKFFCD
jgi:hypothetical protein